jgi:hypothetical protein
VSSRAALRLVASGVCPRGANGRLAPSAQDKSPRTLARLCGACPRRFSHTEPRSHGDLRRGLSPLRRISFHVGSSNLRDLRR